jgi:hypothetical protein
MDTNPERPKWRPVAWVAYTLSISKSHAHKLVSDGCFVSVCLGRNGGSRGIRVREDSVYEYLERKALAMSLADPGAAPE